MKSSQSDKSLTDGAASSAFALRQLIAAKRSEQRNRVRERLREVIRKAEEKFQQHLSEMREREAKRRRVKNSFNQPLPLQGRLGYPKRNLSKWG